VKGRSPRQLAWARVKCGPQRHRSRRRARNRGILTANTACHQAYAEAATRHREGGLPCQRNNKHVARADAIRLGQQPMQARDPQVKDSLAPDNRNRREQQPLRPPSANLLFPRTLRRHSEMIRAIQRRRILRSRLHDEVAGPGQHRSDHAAHAIRGSRYHCDL
jgi:hypothetical protein